MADQEAIDPVQLLFSMNNRSFPDHKKKYIQTGISCFWTHGFKRAKWHETCLDWFGDQVDALSTEHKHYLAKLSIDWLVTTLRTCLEDGCPGNLLDQGGPAMVLAVYLKWPLSDPAGVLEESPELNEVLAEWRRKVSWDDSGQRLRKLLAYLWPFARLNQCTQSVFFPVYHEGSDRNKDGIIEAEVWIVPSTEVGSLGLNVEGGIGLLPWSQYVYNDDSTKTLQNIRKGLVTERWIEANDTILLNLKATLQPPDGFDFLGASLGLAVALAAFAAKEGLVLHPIIATGEVTAHGKLKKIDGVSAKWDSARLLAKSLAVSFGQGWTFLYCEPRASLQADEQVQLLPVSLAEGSLDSVHEKIPLFDFFQGMARKHEENLDKEPPVFDDGLGDGDFYRVLVPMKTSPAPSASTIGEMIEERWVQWDSARPDWVKDPACEMILCTPFHANEVDAKQGLQRTAQALISYLGLRREEQLAAHQGHTRFPVPVGIDLAGWRSFIRERHSDRRHDLKDLVHQVLWEDSLYTYPLEQVRYPNHGRTTVRSAVDAAFAAAGRFCFVVFDSQTDLHRKFGDERDPAAKDAVECLIHFCSLVRPKNKNISRDHCFILIAPDIHVQMFWESILGGKGWQFEQVECMDFDPSKLANR